MKFREESNVNKDDTLSDHLSHENAFKVKYPKSYIHDHEERLILDKNSKTMRNLHAKNKFGLRHDTFTEISGPHKKVDDTISEEDDSKKY